MKTLLLLALTFAIAVPANAQNRKAPKANPANSSRKLVDAYIEKLYSGLGDLSGQKPKTALAFVELDRKKTGRGWTPKWQLSKDGKTLCVRYMPKDDKRLEYGQVNIFVTTHPFKGKLKDAPHYMDEAKAIEFEIQHYLPQKWQALKIGANNTIVRGYMDAPSGGADNEMYATEPFAIRSKDGKIYWLVVKTESGYHKSKGMNLQKSLDALVFP